jgi:hypothetical protein
MRVGSKLLADTPYTITIYRDGFNDCGGWNEKKSVGSFTQPAAGPSDFPPNPLR